MPDAPSERQHSLPLRRRFAGVLDENGEPYTGWEMDTQDKWVDEWPPCPDGRPLELGDALGFRERNIRELELRVVLGGDCGDVCQVVVDERDEAVHVRILTHRPDEDQGLKPPSPECDWPVRVSLVRPLGERPVVDMDGDQELPLYTPMYLNNVLQPDHGYRPVRRRRRT